MTSLSSTNRTKLIFTLFITAAYGLWFHLIGRQYSPFLMFLSCIAFVGTAILLLRPRLRKFSLWPQLFLGACIGYFASIFSAAVTTLALYGPDQLVARLFPSSLYVYPAISFGWLYGAIVVAILAWPERNFE
ncbi:hypothetical protein [Lysobacter terrae]